jgi:hypothetical protein
MRSAQRTVGREDSRTSAQVLYSDEAHVIRLEDHADRLRAEDVRQIMGFADHSRTADQEARQ